MNGQKTGPVASEMLARLNSALSPAKIELIDDSEQHRGHGGYNPAGESHFSLTIESAAFAGKSSSGGPAITRRGSGLYQIARVGEDYLERLPGRRRRSLPSILIEKLRRR